MSNPIPQQAMYDVVPEGYPQEPVEVDVPETQDVPQEKKNWGARLFAIVFIALCIVPVLLPIQMLKGASVTGLSFLNAITDLFAGDYQKLFGALPFYADVTTPMTTTLSSIAGFAFYITLAMLAVSAVLAIITVFCSQKAPKMLRVVAFLYTFGMSLFVITTILVAYGTTKAVTIDVIALALAVIGGLIYFVLGVAKNGKTAWFNTFMAILTTAVTCTALLPIMRDSDAFNKGLEALGLGSSAKLALVAIYAVSALAIFVSDIRIQTKKGIVLTFIVSILQYLVGIAICYLISAGETCDKLAVILAILSAFIALIQMVICMVRIKAIKNAIEPETDEEEQMPVEKKTRAQKKAEKQAKKEAEKARKAEKKNAKKNRGMVMEAPAPAVVQQPTGEQFIREEYAEALPYEGGPVEGVALAEEVNPTFNPAEPPQVQTAGYDFYNCKSFDPFIATLDSEERNQFTELFVLKFKGTMPEIPDYEVGGDNKEFFRKLFIYLGQYRDRIPDGLLSKIYQFAIKLS